MESRRREFHTLFSCFRWIGRLLKKKTAVYWQVIEEEDGGVADDDDDSIHGWTYWPRRIGRWASSRWPFPAGCWIGWCTWCDHAAWHEQCWSTAGIDEDGGAILCTTVSRGETTTIFIREKESEDKSNHDRVCGSRSDRVETPCSPASSSDESISFVRDITTRVEFNWRRNSIEDANQNY